MTIYESENCNGCPYKDKCTKAKGNKRLHVSKDFLEKRNESLKNISTPEGVFGVLKQDYAFRRFLLRGKKNVLVEFTLLAFAYNIQKLFNKNIKNTNGILLHIPKTA